MKTVKAIVIGVLLFGGHASLYAQSEDTTKSDKEKNEKLKIKDVVTSKEKTKIKDVIKTENTKKEKTKIADVVKDEKKKSDKKIPKLSLDEKRAILAKKKKAQKIKDEAKAEALYQKALQDAIESVR